MLIFISIFRFVCSMTKDHGNPKPHPTWPNRPIFYLYNFYNMCVFLYISWSGIVCFYKTPLLG